MNHFNSIHYFSGVNRMNLNQTPQFTFFPENTHWWEYQLCLGQYYWSFHLGFFYPYGLYTRFQFGDGVSDPIIWLYVGTGFGAFQINRVKSKRWEKINAKKTALKRLIESVKNTGVLKKEDVTQLSEVDPIAVQFIYECYFNISREKFFDTLEQGGLVINDVEGFIDFSKTMIEGMN
jgi:hypothetical protein